MGVPNNAHLAFSQKVLLFPLIIDTPCAHCIYNCDKPEQYCDELSVTYVMWALNAKLGKFWNFYYRYVNNKILNFFLQPFRIPYLCWESLPFYKYPWLVRP